MKHMKTTLTLALAAAALLACSAQAQTTTTTTISPILQETNGLEIVVGFETNTVTLAPAPSTNGTWQIVKNFAADLKGLTNVAITPYFTYASSHPKGSTGIGGGVFVTYNVNNYIGAGLGFDDMGGQLSVLSGTVTLKLSQTYTIGSFTFTFTPFALLAIGTPVGGSVAGSVTTRTGGGAYLEFGHWLNGRFVVGGLVADVQGAGAYSGQQTSAFIGWKKGF